MSHFLHMGGYAAFVWPSFALAAIVFAWNIHAARRLHSNARERALRRAIADKGVP